MNERYVCAQLNPVLNRASGWNSEAKNLIFPVYFVVVYTCIVAGELNHRKGNLLLGLNHCPDLGLDAHTGKSNVDYQEQRARDT